MGATLLITRTDLRRRLRNRSALILAFVAPFGLASIMGFAFGGRRTSARSGALISVAVADEDQTPLSRSLLAQVTSPVALGPVVSVKRYPTMSAAFAAVGHGQVVAAVALRRGFSSPVSGGPVIAKVPVESRVANGSSSGRGLTDGIVRGILARVGAGAVVRAAAGGPGPAAGQATQQIVAAPLPIGIRDDFGVGSPSKSILGYFAPSMVIIFLFLLIGAAGRSVLAERSTGTMARLQAAPIGTGSVVAGKVLSILLLSLLSVFTIWGATTALFGAYWGPPVAVMILGTATVLSLSGLSLFVTVFAKSEAGAEAATVILGFTLALLGGNFFPPGSLPPLFEKLALLTPNGWALNGFGQLALDARGLSDILRPIFVLLAIGAVFGTAAVVRLRQAVT
ncbi:MAG: linearmycin/streptolysin transport system permease protein [Actinomycetota bacterium]|nr:linearmycin/streptolysin transport system permease protein [Actinomycetota bacterium]